MNQKLTSVRKPFSMSRAGNTGMFPANLFEEFFNQVIPRGGAEWPEMVNAPMNVAESDRAFEVTLDVPGVNSEDVDIQIDKNTLTVRGERHEEQESTSKDKQFHRMERFAGSFSRSVVLPSPVNEDETVAEIRDGVLTITIPKTEDAKPRKISIKK